MSSFERLSRSRSRSPPPDRPFAALNGRDTSVRRPHDRQTGLDIKGRLQTYPCEDTSLRKTLSGPRCGRTAAAFRLVTRCEVRSCLAAGGKWIRTLGPAKVTCLKRGLYITGSSSTSALALPPGERGAARFGPA